MANGSYSANYTSNFTLQTHWSSASSSSTNKSSISADHHLVCGPYGALYIGARTNSCIINGVTKNFSSPAISTSGGSTIYLGTTSGYSVDHDSNGKKSVGASTVFNIQATINSTYVSNITANGTLTLDDIPRASTVTCTDAYIESTATIIVSRKSTDFTHSITYAFGNKTGVICEKSTDTTIPFTLPADFYSQIINAKSGTGAIYCTTYNSSGVQVGDVQSATFTASTNEKICKPIVSLSYKDSNSVTTNLTGDVTKFIKYFSNAQCTLTATAMNSATIKSTKITCEDGKSSTSTSTTFNSVESATFYGSATDSRGYSTDVTLSGTLINYIKLTCNPTLYRPEPTTGEVYMKVSGNFFNNSFGSKNNSLVCRYRYKESSSSTWSNWINVSPTLSANNTYSCEKSLGTEFDYTKSYNFQVNVYDQLMNLTVDKTVSQGIPVFDWGKNDFNFNVPVSIKGNAIATNLPVATGLNNITSFDDVGENGQLFKSGLYSAYVNNLWYHLLNIRHRNGLTDGTTFGLQIRSRFTNGFNLEWRKQNSGTWTEWTEIANKEKYSTTEQVIGTWIDGKPIYRKVINFGTLPNATTKEVAHNISSLGNVVNLYGVANNGDTYIPLPRSHSQSNVNIVLEMNKTKIIVNTGYNFSSYSAYITVEYTKTTD